MIIVVDSQWAWAVPIGGFVANILLGGFAKSYGLMITAFQDLFGSPTAYFTLAGGLIYTFMYILSLLAHVLCQKLGTRPVIFAGGVGACASLVGASYAPNIWVWIGFIGFGLGISLSMIHAPVFITVGRSFHRGIGKASGLSVAGVSVGQIVFPYIIVLILDTYAARGGCMIGGAIMLHFVVAAVLMPRHIVESKSVRDEMLRERHRRKHQLGGGGKITKTVAVLNGDNRDVVMEVECVEKQMEVLAMKDMSGADLVNANPTAAVLEAAVIERVEWWRRLSLLLVFIVLKVFADVGEIGLAFILPVFGEKDCQLSNDQVTIALAVAGGVDLITRLFIGWLSDRPHVRRSFLLLIAYLLEMLVSFLFVLSPNNYAIYVACYGLFGACSGVTITLMVVVLSDFVQPKHLPHSFAITMVVLGCFIGAGQFMIGYLRDVTGNFNWSFYMCGILLLISCVILCLEYPIRWFCTQWEAKLLADCRQQLLDGNQNHVSADGDRSSIA